MELNHCRNFQTEQETEETYKHGFIKAWKETWEEFDEKKEKWNKKSKIICQLYRKNHNCKYLNLVGCNDGSTFTSVNQAVNQAKALCNYDDEIKIDNLLYTLGYINEDFFKYNSLKDLQRIEEKIRLYSDTCKKIGIKEEEEVEYEWKKFKGKNITSLNDDEFINYLEKDRKFKNINILKRVKATPKDAVWYTKIREDDCIVYYEYDFKVIKVRHYGEK